jgi:ribosomal-protein-alanine N-acetyltransferase
MAGLLVRPMSVHDLDAVIAIESDAYQYPWTRGHFMDSMSAGYTAMCLVMDQTVQGYFVMMRVLDECHLLNISIRRSEQNKGWGRFLLDWCCNHVRSMGCTGILLEVRPSNEAARSLYERSGFRLIGVRKAYYPAPVGREDALVQFKSLESLNTPLGAS